MANRRSITVAVDCSGPGRSRSRSSRRRRTTRNRAKRRKRKFRTSSRFVDDVAAGQPAPNDLGLTWVHEDFLKATGNKEYVPFTVTFDPSKVTAAMSRSTGAWSRRTRRRRVGTRARGQKDDKDKKDDKKAAEAAITPTRTSTSCRSTAGQTGPARISRSFTVPAGDLRRLSWSPRSRRRTRAEERAAAEDVG